MEALVLETIKDSKFLVSGGAGFIGSNLCDFLVQQKAKNVICLDNLSNGNLKNIKELLKFPNFTFVQGDIRNFQLLINLTRDIDYVLHQAAWGSVSRSMNYPLEYSSNNVLGTHYIFEASRINKVKKVIYASSSSVYGDHSSLPKVEGIEGNLLSPYSLSKTVNEKYGKLYWEVYKLPTIGLRYFNVYGKKQNPNGDYAAVIPKFINMILKGESPVIYGDGNQSRDFTYIDDVIQANLKASTLSKENSFGKSFNIAFGENIKIKDLFILIRDILKSNLELKFSTARNGDILHSLASIKKANDYFSYKPYFNLKEGLIESIEWYKNNL